MKKEKKYH